MRMSLLREPQSYPWGVKPRKGYKYYEVDAACSSNCHFSHPACEPAAWDEVLRRVAAGELILVRDPILTDRGWEALVAKKGQ